MAASANTYQTTPVAEDANWRNRIKTEHRAANGFGDDWGFLAEADTRALSKSRAPVQYHHGGVSTVRMVMVPERRDAVQLDTSRLSDMSSRPATAMDSVLLTSSMRLQALKKSNPFFGTTSSAYGGRLTIEQFGRDSFHKSNTFTRTWGRR